MNTSNRQIRQLRFLYLGVLLLMLHVNSSIFAQKDYGILAPTNTLQSEQLQRRQAQIAVALAQTLPVLQLEGSPQQTEAQQIALQDARFVAYLSDTKQKKPFLNEVFGVYPLRPSDYGQIPDCQDGSCYRVELYNYGLNLSTIAMVNLKVKKVLQVAQFPNVQPDIPVPLKELALHIASESAQVKEALGFKPDVSHFLMSDTKTALNRSHCERSKHLCVAPTFVKEDKALWAVVDLTELKLVGIRWTNVGTPQQAPTERRIQNEYLTECFCKKMNNLDKNDWKMNYVLTSSDGLRISEVEYKGKRIINNAKLVDWHVSYSNTDGFGYSDAVGCPYFSAAAVVAVEAPVIKDMIEEDKIIGFTLEQSYYSEGWPTACNYNYLQRYEFFNDGRFRVAVASLGRGCGNNGTYRPVTRIAFAGENSFAEFKNQAWQPWKKEQWQVQTPSTELSNEGFQYKITDTQGQGYALQANTGQMNDGGRGDNAYVYVTKNKPDAEEGEADLITIGPCCNTDYQQGPEKFIDPSPDAIENTPLVVWYVAQLKNDDREGKKYCWAESFLENGVFKTKTFPCFSGAMFVPLK
jgi:hypothetical protein